MIGGAVARHTRTGGAFHYEVPEQIGRHVASGTSVVTPVTPATAQRGDLLVLVVGSVVATDPVLAQAAEWTEVGKQIDGPSVKVWVRRFEPTDGPDRAWSVAGSQMASHLTVWRNVRDVHPVVGFGRDMPPEWASYQYGSVAVNCQGTTSTGGEPTHCVPEGFRGNGHNRWPGGAGTNFTYDPTFWTQPMRVSSIWSWRHVNMLLIGNRNDPSIIRPQAKAPSVIEIINTAWNASSVPIPPTVQVGDWLMCAAFRQSGGSGTAGSISVGHAQRPIMHTFLLNDDTGGDLVTLIGFLVTPAVLTSSVLATTSGGGCQMWFSMRDIDPLLPIRRPIQTARSAGLIEIPDTTVEPGCSLLGVIGTVPTNASPNFSASGLLALTEFMRWTPVAALARYTPPSPTVPAEFNGQWWRRITEAPVSSAKMIELRGV